MKTTVIGAFPKISDERQDLRRALHKADRGELDDAGLDAVLDETTAWAIDELVGAKEIAGLRAAGAKTIDIEEPALAAHPELIDLDAAAFERLGAGGAPLTLYPYFFPIDAIFDKIARLPIAVLGIDARSRDTSARVIERLGAFTGSVSLGIVDARNTRLETPRELGDLIEAALRQLRDERRLYLLSTTTGLEYLPHDVATKKLHALVEAARVTKGVPA
jgi:5-methyltetrahydropteroyltriglutamate--homocysteine methyltransferase